MNPPTINDAKVLAMKNRAKAALVLQIGGGRFASASYGHTRATCRAMGRVLDQIHDLIADGTIEIPDELLGVDG